MTCNCWFRDDPICEREATVHTEAGSFCASCHARLIDDLTTRLRRLRTLHHLGYPDPSERVPEDAA